MQETIEQDSKSKFIGPKRVIWVYFIIIALVFLNSGPGAILTFMIIIFVIISLLMKIVSTLLNGSGYTIKDLLGSDNKQVRNYVGNKIQKTLLRDISTTGDNTKETVQGEETDVSLQTSINEDEIQKNPGSQSNTPLGPQGNQIKKFINFIFGIFIASIFLFNILPETPLGKKIFFYFTNLFTQDSANRQNNQPYIARIILAILIVFVIFMVIKTFISYHKSDINSPFNS